ncbi:sigma-54 interaction domain-containing protein [Aminicella lysinilytica]|uniref:Arginine utilization regulatory protein n=1 Tax=Aminicella lysinilytica TaxID=433323 RepID=A0A4R6Q0C3_9FIRM|nr:sigma 54-interacting transcriptional regulator [Aminicella lysinilytica]TDP45910.1 arginine utilization regulatory protein [Aminicella lysinilytica]
MLRRYVEQLLNVYNYIDGILVTDKNGYIEYFVTYRPDVNRLKEKNILHKHVTEIYPGLTNKTSSLMRVLETGEAILNEYQTLVTYNGQSIRAINTTMPIKENNKIIGAVDVSRYIDLPYSRQNITLKSREDAEIGGLYTVDDIITSSQCMELVKEKIPRVANTDSSVLIYGETGTGKELVAQSLHTSGKRRNKKFISQNCAAIPGNLLESILFGTTKGSYTGAENKPGLFEIANGGTLFLDEINSMEISVQAKILKAIEEKQVCRLGSFTPIKTDLKIISAVNERPAQCVESGKLREDLFYRLSVVQINVPPLRDRINDLFFLVSYFIKQYNGFLDKEIIGIDEEVEELFKEYAWPGNVRELKNIIEGAFNVASSRFIQKRDLPEYITNPLMLNQEKFVSAPLNVSALAEGKGLNKALEEFEKTIISDAIESSISLVEAAKKLDITKQTLNYKLKKYGIK